MTDTKNRKQLDLICKILTMVLLDIRKEAYENKLAKSYWLSDLVHTVPSALHKVLTGDGQEIDLEDIVKSIESRAENNNIEQWVASIKKSINYSDDKGED